jgi:hypothetical protein
VALIAEELAAWAEEHGHVAENAMRVHAERMDGEAAYVEAEVEAGRAPRGMLQAARAFREAAGNARAAAAELARITDLEDEEEAAEQ